MLVLDADSLMTGESIVGLAQAMENDLDAGIIQTLPLIINRNTLFARLQQFAARIYGPVIAEGLRLWMARDGNYWGHNAIIRTTAFAMQKGGYSTSHVDAALERLEDAFASRERDRAFQQMEIRQLVGAPRKLLHFVFSKTLLQKTGTGEA